MVLNTVVGEMLVCVVGIVVPYIIIQYLILPVYITVVHISWHTRAYNNTTEHP
jgi:hypothetical protein